MQATKNPSKKSVINRIYKALANNGKSLYNDQGWEGVSEVLANIRAALSSYECGLHLCVSVENGGYQENDGAQWKEYILSVEKQDGGKFIGGVLNAHAAGTKADPFKSYDISVMLW